ncbi:hypothetical protein [Flavobacterium sp.]|uniref:hypothetical protein n=1 Tax=Flavobacterium sp. TaxID=239 RepID=UPI004048BB69
MKKLMFSAVALVAFSFAGMASNGEVKEVEIVNNKEIVNNESVEEVKSCGLQYLDDREWLSDMGVLDEFAIEIAWSNFQECLGL